MSDAATGPALGINREVRPRHLPANPVPSLAPDRRVPERGSRTLSR